MEDSEAYQPQYDIVPVLISLCAKPPHADRAGHRAKVNALFSILNSSITTHPAITTHWLLALHKKSPETRPATVHSLMSRALRNCVRKSPERALILSAEIINQTDAETELSEISKAAFCSAFDTAMRKDRQATRIPLLATEAAKTVFDDRTNDLRAHIRRGTMQAQIKLQP